MNFLEAVKAADKGAMIKLPHWGNIYLVKASTYLVWPASLVRYIPSIHSILSDDWEVVE